MWMRKCCRMLNGHSVFRHRIFRRRWKIGIFRGNLTFSDWPRLDTKDVIFGAGELGIQVKMITGDHVAIAKETCRVIGM